jgi:hypothetical protein
VQAPKAGGRAGAAAGGEKRPRVEAKRFKKIKDGAIVMLPPLWLIFIGV